MSASRTRKRREPGWWIKLIVSCDIYLIKRVEAAAKVIEGLATTNGNNLAISRALEIDVADLLKQIQSAKLKTIKGSIDERDALRRSLGIPLCDYLFKSIWNNLDSELATSQLYLKGPNVCQAQNL